MLFVSIAPLDAHTLKLLDAQYDPGLLLSAKALLTGRHHVPYLGVVIIGEGRESAHTPRLESASKLSPHTHRHKINPPEVTFLKLRHPMRLCLNLQSGRFLAQYRIYFHPPNIRCRDFLCQILLNVHLPVLDEEELHEKMSCYFPHDSSLRHTSGFSPEIGGNWSHVDW